MWERNTTGLRESGLKKRIEAETRVEAAIKSLLKDEKNITFNAVIQVAGVSKSWLYGHTELRERIDALRKQSVRGTKTPSKSPATDSSKDTMITALRSQIKELRNEIEVLQKQLKVAYGLVDSQDLTALQSQIDALTQELEVSRKQTHSAIKDHQKTIEQNKALLSQNNEMKALRAGFDGLEAELKDIRKQKNHAIDLLQREREVERPPVMKNHPRESQSTQDIPDIEY